jgi:hypothetical protein
MSSARDLWEMAVLVADVEAVVVAVMLRGKILKNKIFYLFQRFI